MKKLVAYIKPFKLEAVLAALPPGGLEEIFMGECRGYGRQKGQLDLYKAGEYGLTFLPKVRVEVYCADEAVAAVEKALLAGARTGRIGDGKILRATVEQAENF